MSGLAEQIISKPQSPLYKAMNNLSMFEKPVENTKPSVCVLSLMKRNFKDMRSVHQLCGVGYVGCLFKLWSIHGVFCKSFITLKFEDLDRDIYDDPFSSLFIGNIPIINVSKAEKCKLPTHPSSYSALCWDTHFVKFLLTSASRTSTPDLEFAEALETARGNVSTAADCLKVFPMVMGNNGDALLTSKSNYENQTVAQSVPEKVDIESVTIHQDSKNEFKTEKELEDDSSKLNASQKLTKERQEDEVAMTGSSNRHNVSKLSTSSSSSWSSNPPLDLSSFVDIQEEEEVEDDIAAVLGEQPIPRVDIGNRMIISKVCRLSGLVQQFCGVSHCLVHALLSGRLVMLAAAEYYRPLVTLYVRALSTLLPRSPTNQLPVLRWHTGTVTDHHLKQFRLMGICIPERLHVQDLMTNSTLNQVTVLNIETGHISGVAYSGTLVRGVEHYGRKLFVSTSALQASLQSILVSLGLKVYLLYQLKETTSRSASDILKAIAVTKGDWDIIMNLTGILQRQTQDS